MTDWYCREVCNSGYGTSTGTDYNNAFCGLSFFVPVTFGASNVVTVSGTYSNNLNATNMPIHFTVGAGGALPTGISANTIYYIKRTDTYTFTISTTPGGSDVSFSDDDTGTLYCNVGIIWNSIQPGDTIYLCGDFGYTENFPKTSGRVNTDAGPITQLYIKKSGSAGNPITIKKHSSYNADIYRSDGTFVAGCGSWTKPDATNAPNVYRNRYAPSTIQYLFENKSLLTKVTLSSPPTTGELSAMTPGQWGYYNYYIYVYPSITANADPNNNTYTCPPYPAIVIQCDVADNISYIDLKDITIKGGDCNFYNVQHMNLDGLNCEGCKEAIQFTPSSRDINYIDVNNCTVSNCKYNGIYFHKVTNYYHSYETVRNCTVSNILTGLSDNHGIAWNTGTNILAYNNHIHDCQTGITFYTDSYSLTAKAYNNIVHDISIVAAHGAGIDFHGPGSSDTVDIEFYNNIVLNCELCGIRTWPKVATNANCKVYNNAIYGCNIGIYTRRTGEDGIKADIRNNIIMNPTDFSNGDPVCFMYAYAGSNADWDEYLINNNNYYPNADSGTPFYLYTGSGGAVSWSSWQTSMNNFITGNEINSLILNPTIINASGLYNTDTDFKLQSTSPCIRAGTNVGLTTDYDGNPIYPSETGGVPIGAYRSYTAGSQTLPGN